MATYGMDDPMVEAFLDWAVGMIGTGAWRARRARLEATLGPDGTVRGVRPGKPAGAGPISATPPQDVAAWYLVLCERWLHDGAAYDVLAGSRVIPVVQRLGHALATLREIDGAEDRLRRVLRRVPTEMDSVLFELLVALAYAERSGAEVAFIPERPGEAKTPDLRVGTAADPLFVECKRKARTNEYVRGEYRRFGLLYEPVREELKRLRRSWALDFVFHREMSALPDDILAQRVVPALDVAGADVGGWRTLLDDADVTVRVRAADWTRYRTELGDRDVRGDTPQLHHVLFGYDDPSRGFTPSVAGIQSEQAPSLFSRVAFACVGIWSCDAAESVQARTRHHQAELRKAFEQLPAKARGEVHVGAETYDADTVADERLRRIGEDLWTGLDSTRREQQWVYIHLLTFDVPPDMSWDARETCVFFAPSDASARGRELEPKLLLQAATPLPDVPMVRRSPPA
jgi:hypothetical protein